MQHYVNPESVNVLHRNVYVSKSLVRILERDGQITPILVVKANDKEFVAKYPEDAERVMALRHLGWDTILIEDDERNSG